MLYRRDVLQAPTQQVQGLLTAMAGQAQQAAFDSLAPRRDGSLIRAVRLAVAAGKAYDPPKKVDAKTIISIWHQLMSDARLTISSPSSSKSSKKWFKFAPQKMDPAKAPAEPETGPGFGFLSQKKGSRCCNSAPYVGFPEPPAASPLPAILRYTIFRILRNLPELPIISGTLDLAVELCLCGLCANALRMQACVSHRNSCRSGDYGHF